MKKTKKRTKRKPEQKTNCNTFHLKNINYKARKFVTASCGHVEFLIRFPLFRFGVLPVIFSVFTNAMLTSGRVPIWEK